ncbi:ac57 [Troides aeacus nucleopolyhedrovirus]|nr:ac57 [Troides aeacus nucleopolyhedrovirus]
MKHPVYARYLEFDHVVLDLTSLIFLEFDNAQNEEYIIFMNVKKAFYKNFHITCDLSLETLTVLVYEKARLIVKQVKFKQPPNFVDFISFNATDNDNSMIIDFCSDARIIVAKKLTPDETYHQRVSGFLDFQKRNCIPRLPIESDPKVRDALDRELEIKLYK